VETTQTNGHPVDGHEINGHQITGTAITGPGATAHHDADPEPTSKTLLDTRLFGLIEKIIIDLPRAALVLSYVGVILTLAAYVVYSIYHSFLYAFVDLWHGDEEQAVVGLLSGLDGIMIANGVYLIAAGSYIVYVKDKLADVTFTSQRQRPQALRHLSPGALKEKMAASLIGVSSVNLLQILINVGTGVHHDDIDWLTLTAKTGIHLILIVGLLAFARTNKMEEDSKNQAAAGH
jgi:uncharacterized protein (TIGR00645 family)